MNQCPCCGWSKELEKKAAAFTKSMEEARVLIKEKQKHLPRGDCGYCVENDEACNFSCVGV